MKTKKPNIFRSMGLGLGVLAILITYAYGFQVTKVDLAETKSEHRQQQLFRILRALAKPEIVTYEKEEFEVTIPVMVPCPDGGFTPPELDKNGPYIIMTPACADPREKVIIEGHNFEPFSTGPVNFLPVGSEVRLQVGTIEADEEGNFEIEARISNRPSDQEQVLSAITRKNVGSPQLTKTAHDTWDKIVETVFLALLATTIGTILAIPLSFIAARNLMRDITSTLTSTSLSILFIPVGLFIGMKAAGIASTLSLYLTDNFLRTVIGFILASIIIWGGLRFAIPQQETTTPPISVRVARVFLMMLVFLTFIVGLNLLSYTTMAGGVFIGEKLGAFGFLGTFIRDLGDILGILITVISALSVAGVFSSLAGRLGILISQKTNIVTRIFQVVLAAAAGALLFVLIAATLNWFYQFRNYGTIYLVASIIGGVIGFILGIRIKTTDTLPTGLIVYFASRTIFNALRSIEALVMAIVFVVWVGIGPFAGSLALALHTIAALAKLYSEQVESIMAGPIEAIRSTGANRMQTIIYGVVPQIIPPYISFTMYRWDINVRMSTIIGFAGGGGIGFLLQQNINLLQYRAASAQMVAIAVVVAIMDYISSFIRERIV
jgi:phosphonate ABC transporter permease subunit PhnE